jgi:hypothetical protein
MTTTKPDATPSDSSVASSAPDSPSSRPRSPTSGTSETNGLEVEQTQGWEEAVATTVSDTRQKPWKETVAQEECDYSKTNYYTVGASSMSYDETTN